MPKALEMTAGGEPIGAEEAHALGLVDRLIEGLGEGVRPREVGRVGVIGAGTMGGGIAMNFLSAGGPVTVVEATREAPDRGVVTVRKNYEATAAKGRLTAEQVGRSMGLLTPTLDFGALAECDLVVEAVFEDMGPKREVFGRLDRVAVPDQGVRADGRTTAAPPATGTSGRGTFFAALNCFRCVAGER